MKKEKKYFIILGIVLFLIASTYYWDNRYVELRPVIANKGDNFRRIIVFQNDLFIVLEPNQAPPNFYKNIKFVLDREHEDYIVKNGVIFIRNKSMRDREMIWNYTTKTNNIEWFKSQREMDSINGDIEKQRELDSIIKKLSP